MEEFFYRDKHITEGTLIAAGMNDIPIPLKYTEFRADVVGMVASIKVIQKFHNILEQNIEALYLFPLPHNSSVNDLEIKTGERIIKSEIREKDDAKRVYEEAKHEGKQAGLLEQERPNMFTISVANIRPKEEIYVTLNYHEMVKYEDGEYELHFPLTMTPRYIPEDSNVSHGEKISPPIQEKTTDREVNIFINLDTGFTTGEITSPTHAIHIRDIGPSKKEISLSREGEIPNKDFILKYSQEGKNIETHITFYKRDNKAGTFMFHMMPKIDYGPEELIKREIIFVLDRSGSMGWGPMDQAKKALRAGLRTLRTGDCFSIITFDNKIDVLSETALEFNDENLATSDKFIDKIHARGGTDILKAMKNALKRKPIKDYLRQVVFLTDGAVGNEEDILREIKKILGKSRIFTFGIGPSVNRFLLDKMAEIGRGTAQYIQLKQDIEEAIQKFSNQTAFPVLCDISLEWENGSVADIYPSPVVDLYFGQTLCLFGRYHSTGRSDLIVKGITRTGEFKEERTIDFPEKDETYPVIETLWAKKRIDMLIDRERERPKEKSSIRDEIIGIAMKYHLMSPHTSLVAVEKDKNGKESKELITINVPLILPEGLNYEAFGGGGGFMGMGIPSVISSSGIMRTGGQIKVDLLPSKSSGGILGDIGKTIIGGAANLFKKAAPVNSRMSMSASLDRSDDVRSITFEKTIPSRGLSFERQITPEKTIAGHKDMMNLSFKWLIRNQNADGSLSNEKERDKKIISTGIALLAYMGYGHTNKTGNYKPQIGKAIHYIESNINEIRGLALAISSWVFFELYNIIKKDKEKNDGERVVNKLKNAWHEYMETPDKIFAALGATVAIRTGLAREEDFPHREEWLSEEKTPENITQINNFDNLLSGFMAVISGKMEIMKILKESYIKDGQDSGMIKIGKSNPLDMTSGGLFILSWPDTKLIAKENI